MLSGTCRNQSLASQAGSMVFGGGVLGRLRFLEVLRVWPPGGVYLALGKTWPLAVSVGPFLYKNTWSVVSAVTTENRLPQCHCTPHFTLANCRVPGKEPRFPWAAEQHCTREQVRGMWERYCHVFCYHGKKQFYLRFQERISETLGVLEDTPRGAVKGFLQR